MNSSDRPVLSTFTKSENCIYRTQVYRGSRTFKLKHCARVHKLLLPSHVTITATVVCRLYHLGWVKFYGNHFWTTLNPLLLNSKKYVIIGNCNSGIFYLKVKYHSWVSEPQVTQFVAIRYGSHCCMQWTQNVATFE